MKKFNALDIAAVVIWLLPAAYLYYIYPSLPASVALHFGIDGNPDRYGDKSELIATTAILSGTVLLLYLLLRFLPTIDPKKTVKFGMATFQKLALVLVVFMSGLGIIVTIAASHQGIKINNILLPALGLMFAFIGNVMNNIRPNYFAGIRTPWTLEDPENWKATHRLGSKLWVAGGIAMTVAALLLPAAAGFVVFMSLAGIMTLIPVVYSFIYFKKHPVNKTSE